MLKTSVLWGSKIASLIKEAAIEGNHHLSLECDGTEEIIIQLCEYGKKLGYDISCKGNLLEISWYDASYETRAINHILDYFLSSDLDDESEK